MCGRIKLDFFPELERIFQNIFGIPFPTIVHPPILGEMLPYREITTIHRNQYNRVIAMPMFWNLVPSYAPKFDTKRNWFNMRKESLLQPYNRHLIINRRCIIPVSSFFENKKINGKPFYESNKINGRSVKKKVTYEFKNKDNKLMALGGVFSVWKKDKETRFTCSIITMDPNSIVGEVHDRMPFILPKENIKIWLDSALTDLQTLFRLVQPYPSEQLIRVNVWPGDVQNKNLFD